MTLPINGRRSGLASRKSRSNPEPEFRNLGLGLKHYVAKFGIWIELCDKGWHLGFRRQPLLNIGNFDVLEAKLKSCPITPRYFVSLLFAVKI